eukprot:CAMPEP_0201559424 /NCGR_PEP_ID=MMETSP0173_2-20130828/74132_1 /ASSEMBLY_ACC=CAM_ASM_000268 /TAXON_ID=218659 /ORGANISM="Vexillifera sp., Strain DIVA3 564/2" /LENGTH=322 /DNA_ID=CAMNT_0047973435 /DNA_START=276 /DNA_END=1241 /DNA_ORIENTATION=-
MPFVKASKGDALIVEAFSPVSDTHLLVSSHQWSEIRAFHLKKLKYVGLFAAHKKHSLAFDVFSDHAFSDQQASSSSTTDKKDTKPQRYVISGGQDRLIFIWRYEDLKQVHRIKAHKHRINSIQVCENTIISAESNVIKTFDVRTASEQQTLNIDKPHKIVRVLSKMAKPQAKLGNELYLFVALNNGEVHVYATTIPANEIRANAPKRLRLQHILQCGDGEHDDLLPGDRAVKIDKNKMKRRSAIISDMCFGPEKNALLIAQPERKVIFHWPIDNAALYKMIIFQSDDTSDSSEQDWQDLIKTKAPPLKNHDLSKTSSSKCLI